MIFQQKKGTNVRIITGYLLTCLFIPAFIMVVILSFNEAEKAESFTKILDEKIDLTQTKLSQTTLIAAANGKTITEIFHPMNRSYRPSNEIPDFIKNVFIVSEDQNFNKHPGFDLPAIGRALAINSQSDGIEQGASTITQQLARNLYLNHHQSYNRKLSEILYAYQLERTFSKTEIMEQYLNAIYFQNNAYGIQAAADFYFQKKPLELSEAEQAFLAAIPNNPNFYDPLKHFDRTKERQERLVDLLVEHGMLQLENAEKLKREQIALRVSKRKELYPDYTSYVLNELRELVSDQEKLSTPERITERVNELLSSGIIIHTGLEPRLQEKVKNAVTKHIPFQDIEGAAAVVNHESGRIVALSGGKNYHTGDFNRSYQAFRQPGSSIKPLLVYAPYFERNSASASSRINAGSICVSGYCPKNYGGSNYGMVTLEKAFIHS